MISSLGSFSSEDRVIGIVLDFRQWNSGISSIENYITKCLKRFWRKNCVYYPWKQIADKAKSMTTISPAWMIPALGLTWFRNSQDMRRHNIWTLDTCQMPEYTRLMFTNNGAHVTARNVMYFCSSEFYDWLYFFLCRFPSWWLLEKICILCLKCEKSLNADKKNCLSKSNCSLNNTSVNISPLL